jgi:diaminobutyrate acetyltransferase
VLRSAPSLLHDRFREGLSRLETWEQTMTLATLQRIASMMDAEDLDAAPLLAPGPLASQEPSYSGELGGSGSPTSAPAGATRAPEADQTAGADRSVATRTGDQESKIAKLPSSPLLRVPRADDAKALWELIRDLESLDLNSAYAYLLVCTHFQGTSIVAEWEGRLVGFVAGYRPPGQADTLFVWQIGVTPTARRRGLGARMIREILVRAECAEVRFVEATVTESSGASEAMFRAFASAAGAPCQTRPRFAANDFPGGDHEPETLFRIGPIPEKFLDR